MSILVYLDYAATTPVDPRVAAQMSQFLTYDGDFGNPASAHRFGLTAKDAVENARHQVAQLIQAAPEEIVWTSGATEANNLALKGVARLYKTKGKHIITVKTEHPSVLDCCQQLEKEGFLITYLAPQPNGLIAIEELQAALREDTILVSIMHVNNEIGIVQDIQSIGYLTASRGILFHVDAAQSAGKIPIDLRSLNVDLMSFCAHKIYGPKGMGALYLRKKPRVRVAAQMHGGGHELGMRSGTLATHQIVGMGEAFNIAKEEMVVDQLKVTALRELFLQGISAIKSLVMTTDINHAIPNIMNLHFDGIPASKLIAALPELAISAGSACHAKGVEASYVLRALGQSEAEAACGVRFSFGRFTTQADIEFAVKKLLDLNL